MRALRRAMPVLCAGTLGVLSAVLISCGSSSKGLIPTADAGPLRSDFEAVARAAQGANGNCSSTETALAKTEQDFDALPASVDSGLHSTLHQGIANLRARALVLCAQPLGGTTSTATTATTTTPTTTTPTTTTTTPTTTTPTTTTPTEPEQGGGTTAPSETPGPTGEGASGGVGPGEGEAGK